jgi:hypothetical protein
MSGYNTNTNFGGLKRKGTNNVFCKIKEDLNRGVTGLGRVAHMIHNCAHSSIDTVPLDTEDLVVTILVYFHIFTVRVERLKEYCDFVGQQYKDILGYGNVRWLSLLPAVRRICELYPALQSLFMSEEKCPVLLKSGFLIHVPSFVNSKLPLFHDAIRKAEGQEVTAVESCMILSHLKDKLNARKEEHFILVSVRQLLSSLEEDGS